MLGLVRKTELEDEQMKKTNINSIHTLKLGFTRCYLVQCGEGYLLIDTSYPQYYSRFEEEIGKLGIPLSRIKYLLLTHHHDDHAGFAAQLSQESSCRVIVHRDALPYLKQGKSAEDSLPINRRVKLIWSFFRLFHKEYKFPPFTLTEGDIILDQDDTEVLKEIGVEGQILCTPGHTNDSISLVLPNGQAFVGDAAMNFLPGSGIRYRPVYVQDIDKVYESWRKLKVCGAKMLYPAHGAPFGIDKLENTYPHVFRNA